MANKILNLIIGLSILIKQQLQYNLPIHYSTIPFLLFSLKDSGIMWQFLSMTTFRFLEEENQYLPKPYLGVFSHKSEQ